MTNSLDRFLIDSDQVDIDRLSELVDPFLQGIDKKSGIPYFKPIFRNTPSKTQILLFLLARKVAHQLKSEWPETMSVSELVKSLPHIPEGTIKPTLSQQLKNEGLVDQDEESRYFIPNHVLRGLSLENAGSVSPKRTITSKSKKSFPKTNSISKTNTNELSLDRAVWEQYIEPLSKKGNYLERSLLVLKIAKDNGHDQGISPTEIECFLKEKVGFPVNSKNISLFLGKRNSRTLSDREKRGKSYFYRIMGPGEQLVNEYLSQKMED